MRFIKQIIVLLMLFCISYNGLAQTGTVVPNNYMLKAEGARVLKDDSIMEIAAVRQLLTPNQDALRIYNQARVCKVIACVIAVPSIFVLGYAFGASNKTVPLAVGLSGIAVGFGFSGAGVLLTHKAIDRFNDGRNQTNDNPLSFGLQPGGLGFRYTF